MPVGGSRFLLVYGTQTGQAKAIAEELVPLSQNENINADIHCFSKTDKEFSVEREKLIVIITSTTGDGEPPDTVQKFWRRIKKRTVPSDYLAGVSYALLGLGDSNYNNFCNCAKILDVRLQEVGARHFIPPAFADDATGLEVVVEPWMETLLSSLKKYFNMKSALSPTDRLSTIINGSLENGASDSQGRLSTIKHDGITPATLIINSRSQESGVEPPIPHSPVKVAPLDDIIVELNSPSNGTDRRIVKNVSDELDGLKIDSSEHCELFGWSLEILLISQNELKLPVMPPSYLAIDKVDSGTAPALVPPYQAGCKLPFCNTPVASLPVLEVKQLTTDYSFRQTLFVSLDNNGKSQLSYSPGDTFSIMAENHTEEVTWLLDRLGLNGDEMISLSILPETTKKKACIPEFINPITTLREILTYSLDIRSTPRKAFLRRLVECCSDSNDRLRLLHLSSRSGAELYTKHITAARRGFLHVLAEFTSCRPEASVLLENLPRLLPRTYSVCCCDPNRLQFAFNVINLPDLQIAPTTKNGWGSETRLSNRKGLITGRFYDMLKTKDLSQVNIYRRSLQKFSPPDDPLTPLILVGPGTGVAPYIGFLQHRKKLMDAGEEVGACLLLFGNRHRDRDFLFRDELKEFLDAGALSQLLVCFSRDGSTPEKYVYELIHEHRITVSDLLRNQCACIYVCGDALNMARDVERAVSQALSDTTGFTDDEIREFLKGLRLEGRYREDVWT